MSKTEKIEEDPGGDHRGQPEPGLGRARAPAGARRAAHVRDHGEANERKRSERLRARRGVIAQRPGVNLAGLCSATDGHPRRPAA